MSDQSAVGIIIPCYQEESYIADCIQSCLNQETNALIEIIIVDGGSTDNSIELIKQLQSTHPEKVVLLHNIKKTTPISLNIGLQYSTASFKMILGAHSILPKNFISQCLAAFEAQPTADCVGGKIKNHYLNPAAEDIGFAMSSSFGVGNALFRTGGKAQWVDTVAFGMYKQSVFEKIGWFNENLIRNQDDEFNFRLTQAGLKIWFDPNIVSNYYVRSSYRKLWNQYFQYGYWKVYVNKLHSQITTARQLVPAALIAYIALLPFCLLCSPLISVMCIAPLILYFLVASYLSIKQNRHRFLSIGIAFLILHFSYGLGYWKGILQLLLLNQQPTSAHAQHNR